MYGVITAGWSGYASPASHWGERRPWQQRGAKRGQSARKALTQRNAQYAIDAAVLHAMTGHAHIPHTVAATQMARGASTPWKEIHPRLFCRERSLHLSLFPRHSFHTYTGEMATTGQVRCNALLMECPPMTDALFPSCKRGMQQRCQPRFFLMRVDHCNVCTAWPLERNAIMAHPHGIACGPHRERETADNGRETME